MSFKWYKDNLKQTLLTLGMILLVAVALGLAAEMWRNAGTAPEYEHIDFLPLMLRETTASGGAALPLTLKATLSLALASVRVALPIIGVLVAVPLLASRLVHRLYATKDIKEAHDALNRIVFGKLGFGPYLLIKEGKIASGEDTPAGRIGGPASLVIYNDTAVVTEQYGRLKRVLGAGFAQLERFEKVWEIVDLRPQRWVYEVFALTKEGIPISCQADISFKINDRFRDEEGREHTKRPADKAPYPYTEKAVFQAATSKWIREPDREDPRMAWTGRVVISETEGLLRHILAEYRLDWLIAPPQPGQEHPREEIRQRLEEGLRERVGAVGAKILKVELGAIEVKARDKEISRQLSNMISKQWIEAWYADWESRALTSRAEGEAELLRMDSARIQAQAEMVITLTETLQSTIMSQQAIEPYILALRFVEALRWLSYDPYTRDFMPPEALRTLRRLQGLLKAETGDQGEVGQLPEGA